MKLKMLLTRKGCEDGFRVKEYKAGEIYEIRDGLAKAFLMAGFCVPVDQQKITRSVCRRPILIREKIIENVTINSANKNLEKLKLKQNIQEDKYDN